MPTLYLNGWQTEAKLEGKHVAVTRLEEGSETLAKMRVPLFDVEQVVLVGRTTLSTPLLHSFLRRGIALHVLSGRGQWLGGFQPPSNGTALRRLRQYELARDAAFALKLASRLVTAKIRNSRRVLQRLAANRDESAAPEQVDVCNSLQALIPRAEQAADLDILRGVEGLAAATYFRRLGTFFPADMPFQSRSRRPPRDAVNALLSFTYTLVLAEMDAAVRAANLEPGLGFLHEISYGRPSLSLDLIEPLRAPLCDLLVLQLVNHQMLKPADFEVRSDDGGTYLKPDSRKMYFVQYEKAMTRRFSPEKNQPHTDFRAVIRNQVNTLLHTFEGNSMEDFFFMP